MARSVLLLLALLMLSGCWEEQKEQVAECQMEGIKAYPSESLEQGNHIEHLILTCMTAHGYDFDLLRRLCTVNDQMAANPYCYVPSNPIGRSIFEHEVDDPHE
jgi:hypothetical protein